MHKVGRCMTRPLDTILNCTQYQTRLLQCGCTPHPDWKEKNTVYLYLMLGVNAVRDEVKEELTQLYMCNGQNVPVLRSCPGTPKHHEAGQLPSVTVSHLLE